MNNHDCINRQPLHDEIARDIAEFEAKGGQIEKLGPTPIKLNGPNLNIIYHASEPK